jgi:hypothetical protein
MLYESCHEFCSSCRTGKVWSIQRGLQQTEISKDKTFRYKSQGKDGLSQLVPCATYIWCASPPTSPFCLHNIFTLRERLLTLLKNIHVLWKLIYYNEWTCELCRKWIHFYKMIQGKLTFLSSTSAKVFINSEQLLRGEVFSWRNGYRSRLSHT